jgi:hypothetical protein
MKLVCIFCISVVFGLYAQNPKIDALIETATVVFEDDFNRNEKDDTVEDLGKQWKTNSVKRAQGNKQADLRNGVLYVEMYKEADHGTSILHPIPFDDGIVKVKFNMLNAKGLQLNFNDPKAVHLAHAGHVCQISISPSGIKITDQLTGVFQTEIHKMRKSGGDKKIIQQLLEGKSKSYKVDLELKHWYEITLLFQKETLSVYIDGNFIGALTSEGIDHQMKDNIAFALWESSAEFDDLKVWSLN